jgi:hypothetical protein
LDDYICGLHEGATRPKRKRASAEDSTMAKRMKLADYSDSDEAQEKEGEDE